MTSEDPRTETRTVTTERDYPHPPERLWRALTQPHLIAEWLMQNDFAPTPGHRFTLRGDWGGVLDCEVLELEPERSLSYTWNFASDDPAFALKSVVTFTLRPTPAGTRLTVEQTGFRKTQAQVYGGARIGWQTFLGKLDATLAKIALKDAR